MVTIKNYYKMEQKFGTIEVVFFATKDGLLESEVIKALTSLNHCVEGFEGFIGRKLSKNDDGQWMDMVYWTNKESAITAAEKIMQNPEALKAFEVIDESTMQMHHYDVQNEFSPQLTH